MLVDSDGGDRVDPIILGAFEHRYMEIIYCNFQAMRIHVEPEVSRMLRVLLVLVHDPYAIKQK